MGKKLSNKPGSKVKAAGILIMTASKDCEFLLMQHSDRWDLPKGHCEPKETYLETALRETEEETGIKADQIKIDPEFEFKIQYPVQYKRSGDRVFKKKVKYFLGYVSERIELNLAEHVTEHEGYAWMKWDPPHQIQAQTIDPLLQAVALHLGNIDTTHSDPDQ